MITSGTKSAHMIENYKGCVLMLTVPLTVASKFLLIMKMTTRHNFRGTRYLRIRFV